MASVSTSWGTSSNPGITVHISGLQYPAKDYSNFRTVVYQGGVVVNTRSWTYYSSGTSASFYVGTDGIEDNGKAINVIQYATISGTEYLIGSASA
ncbi:hypothetical protein DFP94_103123 [Fontibacillus phaseoli]|uniref:Uncharacterized protein n=1 Tax=Fontibacillus phaseoli TaxID=1416533 RepID=A0A369BIJ2_9BACL|nr:hypothetical protein [Fontibacillus phaseoli]RCX20398.1 hypothetical protein DFP94_103123 [Fontibacillus phaseoli]